MKYQAALADSKNSSNISDVAINESFLKVGYLRQKYVLVSLLIKYNIIMSSTTIELYSRDVVLLSMILERCPFDVASIMHFAII